jgi:hypothetical protein
MPEQEVIGLATIFKVIIGPLLLGLALAYGIYRYRHGRVGTSERTTPPVLSGALVLALVVGTAIVLAGSFILSQHMDRTAETVGSSTTPKNPGSGVDKSQGKEQQQKREPLQDTNVPPAGPLEKERR